MKNKFSILGEEYTLVHEETLRYDDCDGYTDWTNKEIGVIKITEDDPQAYKNIKKYEQQILRHEIIHAFLDNSGLQGSSKWARNEEMVDFFAIQWEKINNSITQASKLLK